MKRSRIAALVLVGAAALAGLTACSSKPSAAECSIVVGKGAGDGQNIKKIGRPGETVSKGDDEDWFLPCGPRNYVITPDQDHGDRHTPVLATTKPAEGDTSGLGSPVKVWLSAYFTPDENTDALHDLWQLCYKYGSNDDPNCGLADADSKHDANWSAGWLALLNENFGPAIDRATGVAMRQFGPDVWTDPSQRPLVAAAISREFAKQVQAATGFKTDVFCASGPSWDPKAKTFDCQPVRFTVEDIQSGSAEVIKQYDQRVGLDAQERSAAAQRSLNATKLAAARAAYGPWAEYALLVFEAIDRCQAKTTCVITLGGSGLTPPLPPK